MTAHDDTLTSLTALPDWETMTAYQRAFRCCETLAAKGEELPSWLGIRQIIGKGSGQDINRAKTDFRAQQMDAIRQMRGISPGIPESLAPLLREIWTLAVQEASRAFDEKLVNYREENHAAVSQAQQAAYDRDQALRKLTQLETELSSVSTLYEQARHDLALEKNTRSYIEAELLKQQKQMEDQRSQLDVTIKAMQEEMDLAIRRLEAAERHALLEVERVKVEENKKSLIAIDKIKKQLIDLNIEKSKLEKDNQELLLVVRQMETEKSFLYAEIDRYVKQNEISNYIIQKNNELTKAVHNLSLKVEKKSKNHRTKETIRQGADLE